MVSDEQQRRLQDLVDYFLEENTKINLSALRDRDACWNGNVLDSLAALELPQFTVNNEDLKILDLGTGGGFPLLPLALCLPSAQFIGLDSVQKKLDAIDRIAKKLELTNVTLLPGRAEALGRDLGHREQYDIVTIRAVAELSVLIEYGAPLLKVGGYLIAWKSMSIAQELEDSLLARSELSCHLIDHHEYTLPEDWGTRQLLVFEKMHPTKEEYPREVGVPKKNPIS